MNTPDKEMKGQGWKNTLESWEPKVDPSGWEALQQRVPSGKLFHIRQWVEGSVVKVARLFSKATLVKAIAVVTLTTAVPSDLTKQSVTLKNSTQIAIITTPKEISNNNQRDTFELYPKTKVENKETTLANTTTPAETITDRPAEVSSNFSKDSNSDMAPKKSRNKTNAANETKTVKPIKKNTESIRNKLNNRQSSASSSTKMIEPSKTQKDEGTKTNNLIADAYKTKTGASNKQKTDIPDETVAVSIQQEKKPHIEANELGTIILKQTQEVDSTIRPVVYPSVDSTTAISMRFKLDSLTQVTKKDTTNTGATKSQRNLALYKAVSVGGGIFSGSSINGLFELANFHFGANYGKVVGARLSVGAAAYQKSTTSRTTRLDSAITVNVIQSYSLQQVMFGLDLQQKIWQRRTTALYLFEGVRGAYRLAESPKSSNPSKFFPLNSVRLSVAFYRRNRYGLFFLEPNVEYQMKDNGNLPNGLSCFGISVGWCF